MKSFTQFFSIAAGSLIASIALAGPSQAALIGTTCERPGFWFTIPDCETTGSIPDPQPNGAANRSNSTPSSGENEDEEVTASAPPVEDEEQVTETVLRESFERKKRFGDDDLGHPMCKKVAYAPPTEDEPSDEPASEPSDEPASEPTESPSEDDGAEPEADAPSHPE